MMMAMVMARQATKQQDTTTTTMATGDNGNGDEATDNKVFNEQTNR